MGRGLLSFLFGFPCLWLLSRLSSLLSTTSSSENVFIRILLVFSSLLSLRQCTTRQFRRDYYFKLSMSDKRLCVFLLNFQWLFLIVYSFHLFFLFQDRPTLADINLSDSVTLTWDSFASSWEVKSSFTWFFILFKQFTKTLPIPDSLNHLENHHRLNYRFLCFFWILSISCFVREISFFNSQEKTYYNQCINSFKQNFK